MHDFHSSPALPQMLKKCVDWRNSLRNIEHRLSSTVGSSQTIKSHPHMFQSLDLSNFSPWKLLCRFKTWAFYLWQYVWSSTIVILTLVIHCGEKAAFSPCSYYPYRQASLITKAYNLVTIYTSFTSANSTLINGKMHQSDQTVTGSLVYQIAIYGT